MREGLEVRLAYGDGWLPVEVPADAATVVRPSHRAAAADQRKTLRDALRGPVAGPPLRSLVRTGQTVAIAVCDVTRPQPREAMVAAILDELNGVTRLDDVVLVVATGTHRANTDAELR